VSLEDEGDRASLRPEGDGGRLRGGEEGVEKEGDERPESGLSISRPVPGSFQHIGGAFKDEGLGGLSLVMFGMSDEME
jgi:hypothetical protein